MRTVAAYSLVRNASDAAEASSDFDSYVTHAKEWLSWKGAHDVSVGDRKITLSDGRQADLSIQHITTEDADLDSFVLNEPISGGTFESHLDLAVNSNTLSLSCRLGTVSTHAALAPVPFDARCPGIVRQVINSGGWTSGASKAGSTHTPHTGREAGRELANLIWDTTRGLPIVAISQRYGSYLHPNLASDLAYDLTGLATVVEVDRDASWALSQTRGRVWSCYAGAIRLYWPLRASQNNPYSHPYWTYYQLLRGQIDPAIAARRIRHEIYSMVLEQSAFQTVPASITEIRSKHRAIQLAEANDASVSLGLAEEEIRNLRQELDDRDVIIESLNKHIDNQSRVLNEEIEALKSQNKQLLISFDWSQNQQVHANVVSDEDPQTVEDAVLQAMDDCDNLVFGDDVPEGIESLAPDAGPPEKILRYLSELDNLTGKMNNGTLGMDPYQWLRQRNVHYSRESYTIRNSPVEMNRRTWNDGYESTRRFEDHLKPNDGTSPDQCVRIYFEYDRQCLRTLVGWVGRHP